MSHRSINFDNFTTDEMHDWAAAMAEQHFQRTGERLELPIKNQIVERWVDKEQESDIIQNKMQKHTDGNK